MKRLILLPILALTISTFAHAERASKCRVKYEVTIKRSENSRADYNGCSMGSAYEEQMTTARSQKMYDVSKQECHEFAQSLIGQRVEVQFLEMVVGTEALYSECNGTITDIRKIKYRR